MDIKEIEALADIIVGKITMPESAFAKGMCGGYYSCSSFDGTSAQCTTSDQVNCNASEFSCSATNNTCSTLFGGCIEKHTVPNT